MNYQIEQWPAFKVMNLHKVKTFEAFEVIPQIWESAWKEGVIKDL